jgi:A/G-specific adenine glycosylase
LKPSVLSAPPGPVVLPAGLADFGERVVRWQLQAGRHGLPWQGRRDPYLVWLSEVMLQQTQVSTVLDYYPRFLQRFPDVASLAAAPLDDVLALWSGLGYYSRARNLHRCAQAVVAQHGGRFPPDAAGLATLPGIGRSTAAAIAAFCYGERAAILDGNVKRVLTRALGYGGDLAQAREEKQLWALAETLLPAHQVDRYTQGLMDLGSGVCTLRQPRCSACPLVQACVAHAQGRPTAYPVKTRKLKRGQRANALLWLEQAGRCWLVQRPATGVWAGLWSLPEFDNADTLQALVAHWPGAGEWLPAVKHVLTHLDWTLQPLRWELPASLPAAELAALLAGLQAKSAGPAVAEALPVPATRWCNTTEALALGLAAPVRRWLETAER